MWARVWARVRARVRARDDRVRVGRCVGHEEPRDAVDVQPAQDGHHGRALLGGRAPALGLVGIRARLGVRARLANPNPNPKPAPQPTLTQP